MSCRRSRTSRPRTCAAHARENLTGYKIPRRIEFRDSLPKTNVGKVLRRALRDEVLGARKTA